MTHPKNTKRPFRLDQRHKYLGFAAPSLIVMAVIMIFPVCYATYYSFFNYKLGSTPVFTGLKNYLFVLRDDEFLESLQFSVLFTVVAVTAETVLGMCIALLLDNITKGRKLLSICIYLPYFISASVCGVIFRWLFISDWGLVSQILSIFGVTMPSWFDSPKMARIAVIIAEIWQYTPFAIIIFFAGLQSVSNELLEAASLDGATPVQKFFNVKLPHLRHLVCLVLAMRMMDAFRMYDRIAVMTSGGPGAATQTVSLYAYDAAFTSLRLGRGCAAGVLILLILAPPIFILMRLMRNEEVD